MTIDIRSVTGIELSVLVPCLADLLVDTVGSGGALLGFIAPVARGEVMQYWLSILPEIEAGTRVLVGAFSVGRIVGAGQLSLPLLPSTRHRAELQKLFVDPAVRSRGVGRLLMAGLHSAARERGRSLILLNARTGGSAERFYKRLGYRDVGVIPGYTLGADGERIDSTTLYNQI